MHLRIPDGHPSLEILIDESTQRIEDISPFGCGTPEELVKFLTHVANAPTAEVLYDVLVVIDRDHDVALLLRRRSDGVLAAAEHVENDEYVDNDQDGFAFVTTETRKSVGDRFENWSKENLEEDVEQALKAVFADMVEVAPSAVDLLATDRMVVEPLIDRLADVASDLHDEKLKKTVEDAVAAIKAALA